MFLLVLKLCGIVCRASIRLAVILCNYVSLLFILLKPFRLLGGYVVAAETYCQNNIRSVVLLLCTDIDSSRRAKGTLISHLSDYANAEASCSVDAVCRGLRQFTLWLNGAI